MYSYNNPSASWQHGSSEPPTHDTRDPRRHRAATAPTYNPYVQPPHPTSHPRVLTPGHIPPTIHNPSLYFGNRPIMATPGPYPPGRPPFPHPATTGYQRPQQWPYDANDSYFPPTKPPVPPPPPPPPPAPEPIPRLPSPSRPRDVLPIPEEQTPISPSPSSAKELAAAIQISQSESMKQAQFLEKLSNQEEEDLARALEESLQSVSLNSYTSGSPHFYNSEAGPSTDTGRWTSTSTGPSASSRPRVSDIDDDEAFARRLAAEDELEAGPSESSMADDEALARRLAAEEEEEEQRYRQQELEQSSQFGGNRPSTGGYTEQPDSITRTPDEGLARRLAAEEEIEKSRAMDAGPASAPPPAYDALPSPMSLNSTAKGSDAGLKVDPQLYRSNSSGSAASYTSSESQSNPTKVSRRLSGEISSYSDVKPVSPHLSAASSVSLPTLPEAEQGVVNGNQFVDAELLHGVSIGFSPPVITSIMRQMSAPMPNIISLPYGRCPPLHFQAPNWRHLLKLMARLSGTRIEPTIEAVAVVKTDLFLRTVIQFIRPHPASEDWTTIIWLTIDHPVPASLPGARKYTNGDVDVLPWSYTLSAMPALLRDNADSQISQTYTIPSTEAVPYPKLPISFPNMALYLQAALDESRRYSSDGSSGMRKLSRMMDRCYPTLESMDLAESSERSGMGRVFRKVMGRGNKNNKQERGGNMDTYELVTPFVPEEWG